MADDSKFLIAPSILSADFTRLGEEVTAVLDAGADIIHFDVMDNHFVPNLTFGADICKALRGAGITAPIDVHLMVQPVERMIRDFAAAGADIITIHAEATRHIDRNLALIRELGAKAGLAFNIATPLDCLEYVHDKLDMVLIMSVNPGFGGQAFSPAALGKLRQLRTFLDDHDPAVRIEVDGGVKVRNIREIAKAGADTFVAGSEIFGKDDYPAVIADMRAEIAKLTSN